jgi:DNA-3-methyladenine glycosylase II
VAAMSESFTITPRGAFSLRESVEFGFGQRHSDRFTGFMRLAFVLDGTDQQVGVVVRQDADGVHGEVVGSPDVAAVQAQVERVLSLDVDATGFDELGRVDPVLGRIQDRARGLRPPLFYSPYEAAMWSVLSARRPAAQMAVVRDRLSRAHGRVFDLAGGELAALPTPDQVLAVHEFAGLPAEKLSRMHDVARAAKDGWLDVERLRRLGPEVATAELQRIRGIGPFYASLVVIRAIGFTDVLPREEPKLRELVGQLYGLAGPANGAELEQLSEPWRPFRTWASVMIRAAGGRAGPPD